MRDWWRRRQRRRLQEEAALQELREEYVERLAARDPDALETSRDWSDNDGMPWSAEVFMAAGLLALLVGVPVLVVIFLAIQELVGS